MKPGAFDHFKKGDTIWYYSSYYHELKSVEILSIGPKFITIAGTQMKFHRATGIEHDYRGIPSRLYPTKQCYDDIQEYHLNRQKIDLLLKELQRKPMSLEQTRRMIRALEEAIQDTNEANNALQNDN